MNGVWEKLCPIFVYDFPGFAKLQAEEQNAIDSLVSSSEKLYQRKNEETEEKEVEPESKHFQTKTMAQAFQMIEDSVTLGNKGHECGKVHQR